jgi:hypothetical protein
VFKRQQLRVGRELNLTEQSQMTRSYYDSFSRVR